MSAVEKIPQQQIAPAQPQEITPLALLDRAYATGNIEIIERTMALYERREARAALLAFNKALAAAKAELPAIIKTREASFGPGKAAYRYEDLAGICRLIDPVLSRHGLHYRWRTEAAVGQPIVVTCVLSHEDGHSETNSLPGPADTSGSKNAIQAIVSTVTYLKRDTLKSALGLAAGQDDDGHASAASASPVTAEQIEAVRKRIVELGVNLAKFYEVMKISQLEDLTATSLAEANKKLDKQERLQREKKI
jgi:hypothetical protein